MKIEDAKIGMKVVYGGKEYLVIDIVNNLIYITNSGNNKVALSNEIETIPHKRIPLSEMPQDEFEELIRLGYEVEYKRCCDGVKTINGFTMVTDDNWKTAQLCLGGIKL